MNKYGWDGSYYLRAFFDNGDKLASCENNECKIDLTVQSFAIMSGIPTKDKVKKMLSSVEKELITEDTIKLISPAFSKSLNNPGDIMNYPEGYRENGGQCNRDVSWYIMALLKTGNSNAYRYYQRNNPINRILDKTEPYLLRNIHQQEISSNETASGWFYKIGISDILGIKRSGNKLIIDPKIPKDWNGYKVVYKYFDTTYNIEVKKSSEKTKKEIELVNDKEIHNIIISI